MRRHIDPETAAKIDAMLTSLRELLGIDNNDDEMNADDPNQKPFKPTPVVVDDPSGNSFFQFVGSTSDSQWNMRGYNRTLEQNITLGLVARPDDMPDQSASGQPLVDDSHKLNKPEDFELRRNIGNTVTREDGTVVPDEIFSFPSTCSSCGHPLETLMQQVNIPYFQVSSHLPSFRAKADLQNIIIMATNCYACGYRDNEIKSGGAVSEKGRKITLKVEDEEDMSRDMLKVSYPTLLPAGSKLTFSPTRLVSRFPRSILSYSPGLLVDDSQP